jgi:hypothetical protein
VYDAKTTIRTIHSRNQHRLPKKWPPVNPDLVVRDKEGDIYTVRYDAVNAMLLNEFLKEHNTVQELKSTVAKQQATMPQANPESERTARHRESVRWRT